MKLLSVRVELKNSLEEQIHQFHRVEEFRSYLERLLGDKQNKMKQTSGNKRSALPQLIKYFDEVGDEAIPELDRLLKVWEVIPSTYSSYFSFMTLFTGILLYLCSRS